MTHGEVASMSGVGRSHHVLRIEHLLGELGNGDSTILCAATGSQGSEASHEEMKTRERNWHTYVNIRRADLIGGIYPC